ncbi:unnamed protein product [Leptosia nina]|uniref:Uncharacterized protein n=1 Tax=Leptosia nina TaxID=320188 RepID=A0AAV1JY08_9NEOP
MHCRMQLYCPLGLSFESNTRGHVPLFPATSVARACVAGAWDAVRQPPMILLLQYIVWVDKENMQAVGEENHLVI